MKLMELSPHLLVSGGQPAGVIFRCPHCVSGGAAKPKWLTCFWVALPQMWFDDSRDPELCQQTVIARALAELGYLAAGCTIGDVVMCARGIAWQRSGDNFDNLTLTPSIDASRSGHWHGFVTNGEIR